MKFTAIILLCLVSGAAAFGQAAPSNPPAVADRRQTPPGPPQPQASASAETYTPGIPGVVAGGTKVEFIKEGFQSTEGPIPMPDGSLLFTEGDRITKINADNSTSTFLEGFNGSGLAFDIKGRLIMVGARQKRVEVIYPKGSETVLADSFEGKPFQALNDLVIDKKGGVYFTDIRNLSVYYLPPAGGDVIKVADDIDRPNGIQLSPDEKVLYVNNSGGKYLLAFDVMANGTLRNRHDLYEYHGQGRTPSGVIESRADGMAVDSEGRIYIAAQAGVEVITPQGEFLGLIELPRIPQNLAFAGPDKKALYIVGNGSAYKIPMLAQGYKGRVK